MQSNSVNVARVTVCLHTRLFSRHVIIGVTGLRVWERQILFLVPQIPRTGYVTLGEAGRDGKKIHLWSSQCSTQHDSLYIDSTILSRKFLYQISPFKFMGSFIFLVSTPICDMIHHSQIHLVFYRHWTVDITGLYQSVWIPNSINSSCLSNKEYISTYIQPQCILNQLRKYFVSLASIEQEIFSLLIQVTSSIPIYPKLPGRL